MQQVHANKVLFARESWTFLMSSARLNKAFEKTESPMIGIYNGPLVIDEN